MHPARHLLACSALGALLFAVEQARARPDPITIAPALASAAAAAAGFGDDPRTRAAFAASARDEALLAREARRRGIDRGDAVVRETVARRAGFFLEADASPDERLAEAQAMGLETRDPVVQRRLAMRLAAEIRAAAAADAPDEATLRAWFDAHRERWTKPATARVAQVFFAGADATERARRARAAIERGALAPEAAARLGDPSLFGAEIVATDPAQLAARMGAELAHAAFTAPVGTWVGPIASSHGVHLLLVRERSEPRVADFGVVASAVESAWRAERGDAALDAVLARLRDEDAR